VEAHPAPQHWDEFRGALRAQVSPVTWQTWLQEIEFAGIDEDGSTLHLMAPSEFHLRWINDKHHRAVTDAAIDVFGDVDIVLTARPPGPVTIGDDDEEPASAFTTPPTPDDRVRRVADKYSFETFVVGQSNRFAWAAALAISEQPGGQYNPLFIYGGAGLGKTHLLKAIVRECRANDPNLKVRYVTSEQFFNEFIDGIRTKRMNTFKETYRNVDVLLLDDVQFLEGKEQAVEEFFHTFNALHSAGHQLVFSADRPPKDLTGLEDRIRSRFGWGLTTDIQPPDVETRLAILRKNAEFSPKPVPDDVLNFIAVRVVDNIRELEGALTRVTAYAALTGQPIDLEMTEDVLQDLVPEHSMLPISTGKILAATASTFGVTIIDLEGKSRTQPLARARQVSMYLCRELTDLSLPRIGQLLGGRDHTTVLHGIKKVRDLMQSDKELFDRVTALLQSLRTR